MKFATIRDFRTKTAQIRRDLKKEREIVLTANGRPFALMVSVKPDTLEDQLLAIRRARFHMTLGQIQAQAKAAGLDQMSMDEIDALIAEVRREKRAGK
jgi:antitoxin (DNA-binding transcriptional repressor) of toxin-antitoxin stability system